MTRSFLLRPRKTTIPKFNLHMYQVLMTHHVPRVLSTLSGVGPNLAASLIIGAKPWIRWHFRPVGCLNCTVVVLRCSILKHSKHTEKTAVILNKLEKVHIYGRYTNNTLNGKQVEKLCKISAKFKIMKKQLLFLLNVC